MRRRKLLGVSSVIASLALGVGAGAWACTEFTSLVAPKSSPALSEVDVRGTGKVESKDAATPVELRWNDVTGPVVATATAKDMGTGVQATIPDVPAGIYFLVAVVDGQPMARTSIEVTSPSGAAVAPVDFRPTQPDQIARTSVGSSSQLVGVAILAGGLVLLFGGALVVMSQRRKAGALASPLRDDDLTA